MNDALYLMLLFAGSVAGIAAVGLTMTRLYGARAGMVTGALVGIAASSVFLALTFTDPTPGGSVDLLFVVAFDVLIGVVGATLCAIPQTVSAPFAGRRNMKTHISIVVGLLLSGCVGPEQTREHVAITDLKFGEAKFVPIGLGFQEVKVTRETNVLTFLPQKETPGRPAYEFGYTFDYCSSVPNPKFTLVITMPNKPTELKMDNVDASEEPTTDSPYVVKSTVRLAHQKATYGSVFGFSQGDPLGTWRFDFYLQDVLQKTVTVNVVEP